MNTMEQSERNWKRKRIRLTQYDYATPGSYFITICTKDRIPLLWENVEAAISRQETPRLSQIGMIVDKAICQMDTHYAAAVVDKYCIMPDHVHLLLTLQADECGKRMSADAVSTIIGSMKRWVSARVGRSIWQKSFIDRVIRNKNGYLKVWEYIDQNPLRIDFAGDNIDFSEM